MPNPAVDVNSWAGSACYPRRTFYPLSDGPSIQNRRITKSEFLLCSTCLSHSQAGLCLYTLQVISKHLEPTFERPAEFDALAYMTRAIASLPREFPVEVLLKTDMATAQAQLLDGMGLLTPLPEGVLLRGRTDALDWYARQLASLEFDFEVREPEALRQAVRDLAAKLLANL